MFPQAIRTGLTLPKILTGINKTLTVANQIIPIYVQAKPMIQNMKGAFQVAKEFMSQPKTPSKPQNNNTQKVIPTTPNQNQTKRIQSSVSNPVFFLK